MFRIIDLFGRRFFHLIEEPIFLLRQAVQCQHERCVNILLENHANPNLVDVNGNTALHLAANIPSISTAVLLLEHDADINAQNKVILSRWGLAAMLSSDVMQHFVLGTVLVFLSLQT